MLVVAQQTVGIDLNFSEPGELGESVEKTLPSLVLQKDVQARLA
jgi:hypothetical protein